MEDTRNVLDEFKGLPHNQIIQRLDERGVMLEIAIENLERDFNMGTIIRSANAFGIRTVHIVGRRQWNKRGAMMTDKYLSAHYYETMDELKLAVGGRVIVAIENNIRSQSLLDADRTMDAVLLFGSESGGLSREALDSADQIYHIPQLGSTRSLNVGVAAGIAMWEWLRPT